MGTCKGDSNSRSFRFRIFESVEVCRTYGQVLSPDQAGSLVPSGGILRYLVDSWCLRGFFLVGGSFSARVCEVGWFRQSGNFFRQVRFPRDGVSVFLAQVDEKAIFGR